MSRAICAGLFAAFMFAGTSSPVLADAAPSPQSCQVWINLAELVAIGSSHGDAEYLVQLGAPPKSKGTVTVHLTAGGASGQTTALVVDGFNIGPNRGHSGSEAVVVVMPSADVGWFGVNGVDSSAGTQSCSNVSFPISTSAATTSFDDTAAWIALDKPIIVGLSDADFRSRVSPEYPAMAREENIQGDVTVEVIVGPDGSVEDAWVKESSGSAELDGVSVAAARSSTFKPAHLPSTYGGTAVGCVYLIIYSFSLNA